MSEQSSGRMERLRSYDWRPVVPVVVHLAVFAAVMPTFGNPDFFSLELHQQIISAVSLPLHMACGYWFAETNGLFQHDPPEEAILDE